jgi:large subunit ribosomal protein L23
MDAYEIIKRPLITEKSTAGIPVKKYSFIVDFRATKPQIKAAVEQLFNVKVDRVNTVNCKGKFKRQNRSEGYTSRTKKAYVMLKPGKQTIPFFDSLV